MPTAAAASHTPTRFARKRQPIKQVRRRTIPIRRVLFLAPLPAFPVSREAVKCLRCVGKHERLEIGREPVGGMRAGNRILRACPQDREQEGSDQDEVCGAQRKRSLDNNAPSCSIPQAPGPQDWDCYEECADEMVPAREGGEHERRSPRKRPDPSIAIQNSQKGEQVQRHPLHRQDVHVVRVGEMECRKRVRSACKERGDPGGAAIAREQVHRRAAGNEDPQVNEVEGGQGTDQRHQQ
jgi:hypothetical protein